MMISARTIRLLPWLLVSTTLLLFGDTINASVSNDLGLSDDAVSTSTVVTPTDTVFDGDSIHEPTTIVEQQLHRDLKGNACPRSQAQEIWYHVKIIIYTKEPVSCGLNEWNNIKTFLEKEVRNIDLFNDYGVSGMVVKLCVTITKNRRRRRHLREGDNNGVVGVSAVGGNTSIYELDFTDDADAESGTSENDVGMHNNNDSYNDWIGWSWTSWLTATLGALSYVTIGIAFGFAMKLTASITKLKTYCS